jgi:hypothetical protein
MRREPLIATLLAAGAMLDPAGALAAGAAGTGGPGAPRVTVLHVKSALRPVADAARAVLNEHEGEILDCYRKELAKDPDPEAMVTMSWTLRASGSVSTPQAGFFEPREDAAGDRLLECLTSRVSRWRFPAPEGGAAAVSVGLSFSTRPGTEPAAEPGAPATGSIDRESLRKVLEAHAGEIQRCYEQELAQDRLLEGKVTLTWTVRPDGSVSAASVDEASTTLRNPRVHECMLARVAAWRFPRPRGGGPAVIKNPWVLSRGAQ